MFVVIGMNSYGEAITTLYKNTKPGIKNILKQDRTQSLLNVCKGDVVWIDYDKDGDSDLLISGVDGSGLKSAKIFKRGLGEDYLQPGSLPAILHKIMDL